jgi:hypothetical protein
MGVIPHQMPKLARIGLFQASPVTPEVGFESRHSSFRLRGFLERIRVSAWYQRAAVP